MFAHLKPKYISFHIEEEKNAHRLVQYIRSLGIKPAVVLNPHTSPQSIKYLIEDLDMILLMSVNPGFGGQTFIPTVIQKAKELKELINLYNPSCKIEVDGGVNNENIQELKDSGVDIVVAGSYVFKNKNRSEAIKSLQI
jgi:ribulose-phosphate 3-epimerase